MLIIAKTLNSSDYMASA